VLRLNNYSNKILKNISFELRANQNLLILGSNGAGKSTLAKALCGIIPSSVKLFGRPLLSYTSKERTKLINYVPAKLEIFDEYITLGEYLELSRLHTLLDSKNLLRLLSLEHLKNKPCQQLSSGEQQLTMLATAVLHNAKITIFDEPTANLDPNKTQDVFSLLKSGLFQSKIIITHDLTLAYRLGYDVLFIKEGEVDFFGSSEEFFSSSTLELYFGSSVKRVEEFLVVDF